MSIQFRTRTKSISVGTTDISGACCFNVEGDINTCVEEVTLQYCLENGGYFQGNNSDCESDPCNSGARAGSCCINGFCYEFDELTCSNLNGIHKDGLSCIDRHCCDSSSPEFPDNNSTSLQACCLYENNDSRPTVCRDLAPCECALLGGFSRGPSTTCSNITSCEESSVYRGSCCAGGFCHGPMGDLEGLHEIWSRDGYTAGDCVTKFGGIFGGSGTTCGGHDTNGNNDIAGVTWPCVFPKGSCCFGNSPYDGDGIDPGKTGRIYCDGGRTAGHTAGSCLGSSGGSAFVPYKTCSEIEDGGGSWNITSHKNCENPQEEPTCIRCMKPTDEDGEELIGRCCIPNVHQSFDYNGDEEPDYIFVTNY